MSFGLYIHIPFCHSKCPYCGICSIISGDNLVVSYTKAVSQELRMRLNGMFAGKPDTLYIGGGTPSIVPATALRSMLKPLLPFNGQEFSIESNPESLNERWLAGMLECGANRISVGIQSLDNAVLATLGRIHTANQAVQSVIMARKAGFGNVSVDLMFGIPGQTMASWSDTLRGVLDLAPDHVSCYSLNIEEDTVYFEMLRRRELEVPDSELTADMYVCMTELFEKRGLFRYEISNFALPGFECRHNMAYWDGTPYLGVGVSAHSFDGTTRSWNFTGLEEYIENCRAGHSPVSGSETLDSEKRLLEMIMLSLRTSTGLSLERLVEESSTVRRSLNDLVECYIEEGFMERHGEYVRLTAKGAVVSDALIADIAAEII